MDFSHISERLSDLPIWAITVFAVACTIVRVGLVRIKRAAGAVETIDAVLIAVVLVFMLIQPFLMKSFYIPSGSMRETLLEDDHIFCNKMIFRISPPNRDNIVIFIPPTSALEQSPEGFHPGDGPIYYIKRLIGLPGDVVQTHMGYITVDGRQELHEDIRNELGILDHDAEHVKIEGNDIRVFDNGWRTLGAAQIAQSFQEPGAQVTFHPGVTIENGKVLNEPFTAEDPEYNFKMVDGKSIWWEDYSGNSPIVRVNNNPDEADSSALLRAPAGPVPPGHILVMGDNRNDSGDSTHWGPLDVHRLTGRAVAIFWPLNRIRGLG